MKVAFLLSHPIHYHMGFLRAIAADPELQAMVYFCSDFGIAPGFDATMGRVVKWYDESLLHGLPHTFLKNASSAKTIGGFWSIVNPSLFHELRRHRYDALVIHGWSFASYWLGILFARLTGTPIFLRVESPHNQEVMKSGLRFTLKKFFFRYFFFPLVSRFLYIGEENKLFYKYYGVPDTKLFFTPYAVDNEKLLGLTAGMDKASLKKAIGVREDATLILMTGKLVEKKRPFDLLEAFQKIQNPQTTLMFVGDGWLRPRLEERVHAEGMSNVLFVGFKNQEELPRYYAAADIFVLPSEQGETWGLVVNEALCFGLPVIVSDLVGSAKDLVRHGENGYIFKAHDCLALANYLTELIGDAEKRRLFGKKSQERIRSYSFAHDVSGLKAALHSLPHP